MVVSNGSSMIDVLFFIVTKSHQLLVYADDVNLLGDNIDTIKKNAQNLIDASKEIGLEVNTEKNKYMSTCCCLVTKMQGTVMT
jgi:hypothetical protein